MAGLADKLRQLLKAQLPEAIRHKDSKPAARRSARRKSGPRWADPEAEPNQDPVQLSSTRPDVSAHGRRALVTPFYLWGTLAFVTAGVALFGLGLQFWPTDLPDEVGQGPAAPDPLITLQDNTRQVLLAPTPELAAELKRGFLGKPDTLCDELRAIGMDNPGWRRAPFQKSRWQCASDLVSLTTPSVDFGSTTLFFLLRGPSEEKVDYLRLKLVVEDPRQKQIGLDAVWLVIDALAGRYGWTVPEPFRKAVAGFEQLETSHRGVHLSVAPEDPNLTDDPLASRRLNIIMNFGEPDLIRPADRFEQSPPLESGWSVKDRDGREGE